MTECPRPSKCFFCGAVCMRDCLRSIYCRPQCKTDYDAQSREWREDTGRRNVVKMNAIVKGRRTL